MEAKWVEDLWWWKEKAWENQMSEKDMMVVLDKETAVVAAKVAVVEIIKKYWKVSVGFLHFYIQILTELFSRSWMRGRQ